MNQTSVRRNIPIDTLRGMACIFLVAYHVIGITPESGLRLHDGVLKEANDLLAYVRMPLFTFLSGFVYAWRPYRDDWQKFMHGKVRRLIIPMLFVGTVFACFQAITPGTNSMVADWRFLHLKPVAHFWFIESLFLIFLVLVPLEHFRILDRRLGLFAVFVVSALLFVSNAGTPWFSIAGAAYLLPFFLSGLYCSRFPLEFRHQRALGAIFLSFVIMYLLLYGQESIGGRRSFNALVIGMVSCVALLYIRFESGALASIGLYSYTIYLFHVFFTAASRIFFKSFGLKHIGILFVLGTIIGLAGPVLVDLVASKFTLARLLLLGKGPLKKGPIPAVNPAG
ncbi:MAG: acyltransferase [Chlorobiaceae bacterium]|nr:acyltransferase [Chlorobiaceae bacterium]